MSETLLELQDVSFSYEDSPPALRGVSLAVSRGERVAVLGSNGAGKSTFFLLCNGVNAPDAGRLLYRGRPVSHSKQDLMRLREQVGIVFQDPNQQLIGSTVEAEVSFGPMNLRLPKEDVSRRVEEALRAMDITEHRKRPPHYLSGGEKKRVGIAGVLAMHPDMILFDEPTASLDPSGVDMLEGVLAQLAETGKTLLVSTHDIDFAWRWARRVLVFAHGELLADSTPEAVFGDDALLEKAGLRRPILYDVMRVLERRGCAGLTGSLPRTAGELEQIIRPISTN